MTSATPEHWLHPRRRSVALSLALVTAASLAGACALDEESIDDQDLSVGQEEIGLHRIWWCRWRAGDDHADQAACATIIDLSDLRRPGVARGTAHGVLTGGDTDYFAFDVFSSGFTRVDVDVDGAVLHHAGRVIARDHVARDGRSPLHIWLTPGRYELEVTRPAARTWPPTPPRTRLPVAYDVRVALFYGYPGQLD